MSPLYDPDILPTLREMRATWTGPTINLWSFVNFKGSLELGYAFASLLWPELIQVQGGIFIAEQFGPDAFAHWMDHLDGNLTRVEAMMNHLHVNDIFLNSPTDDTLPSSVTKRFADSLAGCWRAAAVAQFPHLPIQVEYDADIDPAAHDYEMTLFVPREDDYS
jgi:hypothetical protein